MKSKSIIVVDHFYEDPLSKREKGLSCTYQGGGTYPGMNSVRCFYLDEGLEKIRSILGKEIRWSASTTGHYRISMAQDPCQQDIHADSFATGTPFPQWVGVCYLSLPKDCQGGTSFWKHNLTGLEKYPNVQEHVGVSRIAKIPNTPEEVRRYLIQEGLHRSHWTEVRRVPMVFNRLALFRANLFHSHTCNFGNTPEHCRLVYLLAFDEVDYFIKTVMFHRKKCHTVSSL